jgi:hypothetical protein
VLGDGWTAHTKVSRDFADRLLAAAQNAQYFSPRRIGYRSENGIALFTVRSVCAPRRHRYVAHLSLHAGLS